MVEAGTRTVEAGAQAGVQAIEAGAQVATTATDVAKSTAQAAAGVVSNVIMETAKRVLPEPSGRGKGRAGQGGKSGGG